MKIGGGRGMQVEVVMPKFGLTMESGVIIEWKKHEGDPVRKGEVIAEVESEKIAGEVEAPADGVLSKILREEGDVVPVGEPIAIIETEE